MSDEPIVADEIIDGVYRALCANGYAALTMQDIADECNKSKSLLHYHYDTKEDLLVAFLEAMLDHYETRLAEESERSPVDRLVSYIARFVFVPSDEERESFHLALLEMRSQGPYNDRIREQLVRSDELLRGTVEDILHDGIDEGVFEAVDVERTAALLVATLDGARTRQITLSERPPADHTYTRIVAEEAISTLVEPLLASDVELPTLDEVLERLAGERDESFGTPEES